MTISMSAGLSLTAGQPSLRPRSTRAKATMQFPGVTQRPDDFFPVRFSGATDLDFTAACRQAGVRPGQVVLGNLKRENALGEGSDYTVYGIKTPGLQNFVLRVPVGVTVQEGLLRPGGERDFAENARFTPVNQGHPWRERDNMGIAIGYIGDKNEVEVQRRIPWPPAGSHYQALEARCHFVKVLLADSKTTDEFKEKLEAAQASGQHQEDFAAYEEFQHAFVEFMKILAALPQEAYDEVAEIMAQGYQTGNALDINHANNTMLLSPQADPKGIGRFGFVDTHRLNPAYKPMLMSEFFYTMIMNPDNFRTYTTQREIVERIVLIQNPALIDAYGKSYNAVTSKCNQADQKHRLSEAARAYEDRQWARKPGE